MKKRIKNMVYKIQEEESHPDIYNLFLLAVAVDFLNQENERKIQNNSVLEQKFRKFYKGETYE